jgi:hypothetical protein
MHAGLAPMVFGSMLTLAPPVLCTAKPAKIQISAANAMTGISSIQLTVILALSTAKSAATHSHVWPAHRASA